MLYRYWPVLAGILLLSAIVWSLLPDARSPETETAVVRPSPGRAPSAMQRPAASPFMSAHESTRRSTPSSENVDGRFHAEIEQLRMAVAADSNDVDALLKLARFSQDSHRLDEAITLYKKIVDLDPSNRDAWLDLSRCYGEQTNWPAALTTVDALLEHHPDDPGALYNKGAILANLGRVDEARQIWTPLAENSDDVHIQSLAASALARIDQP